LRQRVADDRVRLLRFLYCDPSGVIRGKQVHAARLAGTVQAGLGLTRAQNAVNVLDDLVPIIDMEPVGEVRIVPDPSTYVRLPWLDGVGSVLSDQVDHAGQDWGCCPRAFLRRTVTRAAEAGIRVRASFENEFYLAENTAQGPVPWGNGPVYSSAGLDRAATVMNDIADALVEQGLVVEQVYLSYDRLRPSAWAGSTVSWGYDNREAALRVASPFRGREEESTNAELKACDASSNPYLALGGLILAGLDGLARGRDLPEPARHDPALMTPEQARRCGITALPSTQAIALTRLEADEVLVGGLGDLLTRCILALRRAEYDRCVQMGDDAVRRATFAIF
jgi:glutamine synthetase